MGETFMQLMSIIGIFSTMYWLTLTIGWLERRALERSRKRQADE
jgi:hypothetical protein